MNLKEVSTEELQKELDKRTLIEFKDKWNFMPENVIETDVIVKEGDGTTLFYCVVDDGCETVPYFLQAKINTLTDEDVIKIAQKRYIEDIGGTGMLDVYNGPNIFNIAVEEIGRYGYVLLKTKQ